MATIDYVVMGFGLILTLLNIVNMIWIFKGRAQEPHKELEQRVTNLEKEVEHRITNLEREVSKQDERIFDADEKIKDLETATKMLLESTRALLANMISENLDEIKQAYKNLNEFLVNR